MSARRGTGRLRAARPGSGHLQVSVEDRVLVVHTGGSPSEHLAQAAEELRRGYAADQATVLVGAGFCAPEALYALLAPELTDARKDGVRTVRLVMARAAEPGGGALAQALAEAASCDVLAPAGLIVVVPGGTVFAPDLPGAPGGWWHFSPGLAPHRTGTRLPEPAWQAAVERAAPPTTAGCVVEQIPAGLLVLPVGVPPEGADALRYAVPPDPAGPLVLVGSSHTGAVPVDALAEVIAALPGAVRGSVRLAPGDGADLLPAGQGVADLLGIPVRVATGLPLLLDAPSAPAGSPRTVLTDAEGEPSWRPYVEAVTCTPAEAEDSAGPSLGAWRPPIGGLRPGLEPGAMMLDRQWEVVVTRAGLWVGPNGSAVPEEIAARPVNRDLMALDVGIPEVPFDPAVWEALDRLFTALQDDVRERTFVQLHGDCTADDLRDLRRLAMRHDLAVAPRDWRGTAGEDGSPTEAGAPLADVLPLVRRAEAVAQAAALEADEQDEEAGAFAEGPEGAETADPYAPAPAEPPAEPAPARTAFGRTLEPVFTPGPLPTGPRPAGHDDGGADRRPAAAAPSREGRDTGQSGIAQHAGPRPLTVAYGDQERPAAAQAPVGGEQTAFPAAAATAARSTGDQAAAEPMGIAGALVADLPVALAPTFTPPVVPPLAGQAAYAAGGAAAGHAPDRERPDRP
ncbi:hypothetical protein SAMN05216267_10663 [Actinacidiphila rubida]|uniref:Uncharacterized protein n=1 Tax=Actinacidiphila rubida TaxID=310780 RepID=A0A1H8U8G2_9ACTN|nr:hypothetical protein [Actinacidiphila rubida]SEO99347.1 hypothetical protein SAMN05216267_10663 [Actinacidiphila rubida]